MDARMGHAMSAMCSSRCGAELPGSSMCGKTRSMQHWLLQAGRRLATLFYVVFERGATAGCMEWDGRPW